MALHIRDDRALRLAKKLAAAKGVTMTQAVLDALEAALAHQERPLHERLANIAQDLKRASDRTRGRTPTRAEIDDLWGNR